MIDFHSHILPNVDDGSESIEESLEMLSLSFSQGIDTVFLTSHFYAYEDNLNRFLSRRNSAYNALCEAIENSSEPFPRILRGAEILYFPGMSEAREISCLALESTRCLLIEPPMDKWSAAILDEIEETGENLRLIPVVAHIDRYMEIFGDMTIADQIFRRKMLAQVNASFLFDPDTSAFAMELLKSGKFQLIGSDAHNLTTRPPNLGLAADSITQFGLTKAFDMFNKKCRSLLKG